MDIVCPNDFIHELHTSNVGYNSLIEDRITTADNLCIDHRSLIN